MWFRAILVASIVATGMHVIGATMLGAIHDSTASPEHWADLALAIASSRSLMFNAIAAELFLAAFDRMPSTRRAMERPGGTLTVGVVLGVVIWLLLRVLWPAPGFAGGGLTALVLLTYALFVGPSIVWVVVQHTPSPAPGQTRSRERGRRIASGLAMMFPALCVSLWLAYTEEGRNSMIAGGLLWIFALAMAAVGLGIIVTSGFKRRATVGSHQSFRLTHNPPMPAPSRGTPRVVPLSAPSRVTPRIADDSLETWTRPVLIAGALGGIAGCIGSAIAYTTYLRWLFTTKPSWMWRKGQLPPVSSYLSLREFVISLGFALLLALLCRARPAVRQRLASAEGLLTVTLVLGCAMWVVTRSFAIRPLVEEPALSILGLLIDVVCVAPAIVGAFRLVATGAKGPA
jgi:hypothetical protein